MKKIILSALLLFAGVAHSATTNPVQLLNPAGSTAGQAVVSTGSGTPPTWGAVALTGVSGTLAIANGGTGATSASVALSNLGAAPLAGATFTGLITPSSAIGIKGTATNDNAQAGSVGEYASATGTSVTLTSGASANLTSISLTAGDWEVSGWAVVSGGTTTTFAQVGLSATSASFDAAAGRYIGINASVTSGGVSLATLPNRFSLSATTTIYLVGQAQWTGGTDSATGFIRARRVR
jgi:hypothetical protein